jgi:NADP-dependent alcohol dehydrogenase
MFYNYNPVKLIHGESALQRVVAELPIDSRVTVLHGATLERHSPEVIEIIDAWAPSRLVRIKIDYGEPTEVSVDALVRRIPRDTSFIIGIGGGSIMDITKAVAVCYGNKLFAAELKTSSASSWQEATKFGLVSTRPGSGTELNNAFVLMDEGSNFKRSYFGIHSYPKFSIHDPIFFKSLQASDYVSGLADAVSHIIDQYLVDREPKPVQDQMSLNFLRIGKELSKRARKPSIEDFLQLAWFSSLISSGIISRGVRTSWILHEVAHSLGSVHGLPHVQSITTVSRAVLSLPRWPRGRLQQIAKILSKKKNPDSNPVSHGDEVAKFFSDLGLPVGFDYFKNEDIEIWRTSMETLCPNLTNEEISYLCTLP